MRRALPATLALLLSGCSSKSTPESAEDPSGPEGPSGQSSAYLAIDRTALYWVEPTRGTVMRQLRAGGEPTVLTTAASSWNVIGINDSDVFYYGPDDSIMSVPKDGGVAREVAQATTPYMIAVDAAHLYFSRAASPTWLVVDHSLGDGQESTLDSDVALSLAIAGTELVGTSCALNGVWTLPRTGGLRTPLVTDAFCPLTVAADSVNVCYADYDRGLYCVPRAGGTARHITPAYFGVLDAFVLDGPYLYALGAAGLVRYAVETGDELLIAQARDGGGIAVADGIAYFTVPGAAGVPTLQSVPLPQ